MFDKMLEKMISPDMLAQLTNVFSKIDTKITEFEQTLARIETRLYNIECDVQALLNPEDEHHG